MTIKELQFVTVEQVAKFRAEAIKLEHQNEQLQAQVAMLADSLNEAADDIESWGSYAAKYFQEKWGLEEDIRKYKTIATTKTAEAYKHRIQAEHRLLMDREIRKARRFYFHTIKSPANTPLAQIFNDLLEANGTHEENLDKNKAREIMSKMPELKEGE